MKKLLLLGLLIGGCEVKGVTNWWLNKEKNMSTTGIIVFSILFVYIAAFYFNEKNKDEDELLTDEEDTTEQKSN